MLNSNDLINKVKVYNKFLNPERLDKAFNFAIKAHQNQKRASGDPYSVHPIEVANILTELKLDSATITTGLLHDTIEDTFATYETIKNEFGDEVAELSLRYGADDIDGTVQKESIMHLAGSKAPLDHDKVALARIVQNSGSIPIRRDTIYSKFEEFKIPKESERRSLKMAVGV